MLKGTINFNKKIGQHTLDDDTLVNFIQNFDRNDMKGSNFGPTYRRGTDES